ncbi:ribonuclease H-like protein, partial [Dentipellis sp. KUC8613]
MFYGPITCACVCALLTVYTDGSARRIANVLCAGSGIYWGPNCPANALFHVPGTSTNNRRELFTVLQALDSARLHHPLNICTDSTYVIHTFCHWIGTIADLGWCVPNSDLIHATALRLHMHCAPVQFIKVKAHSGNAHNDCADSYAAQGA